ncbi:MAG: hypothetical protein WAQ22_02035 [Candidatus Saccharimonas sp.]|jgi:hypothetical protein
MKNDIIKIMKKVDDQIGYDLNEKDIDAVLRYMQLNDPEHASPERAVRFLVTWKKSLRERDVNSPLESDLDEFYKEFIKIDSEQSE